MKKKAITNIDHKEIKRQTIDELLSFANGYSTKYEPITVLKEAKAGFEKIVSEKELSRGGEDPEFKVMTLFEFDKCALGLSTVSEQYKTFIIDFTRKLQSEYQCISASEKATAELIALNFIRCLEIERKITAYLNINTMTELGVKYLAVLSKELDRANRHYLNALQTLRMLKQPALEVIVKSKTAIVGQNQIIQANTK